MDKNTKRGQQCKIFFLNLWSP